jgi:sulfopyruvate decarboxylase TPP-binding subunit
VTLVVDGGLWLRSARISENSALPSPPSSDARRSTTHAVPRWAQGVCAGVHAAGSRDVVYVPDNPLPHVLRMLETEYQDIRLVLATRRKKHWHAAGLYLGGRKPTVMLQSSGIGNSLNAITPLLLPYQIPVLMVMSMRGDPGRTRRRCRWGL